MPKQIHEVTDEKKLRRAIGTTQEFNRDRYDRLTIGAWGHYTGALAAQIRGGSLCGVALPTAADNKVYGTVGMPDHWGKGNLKIKVYTSVNTAGSQVAVLAISVSKSGPGNAVAAIAPPVMAATNKTVTYDAAGTNTMVESVWESGEHDINDPIKAKLLSWWAGRVGTDGADTYAGSVDFWGVVIEWQPIVATA